MTGSDDDQHDLFASDTGRSKGAPDPRSKLETDIAAWLGRIVSSDTPKQGVKAFNVGLFEIPGGYGAYLIGSKRFDPHDSDWALRKDFIPSERKIVLPLLKTGSITWQTVLSGTVDALRAFLSSPVGASSFLAHAEAVTTGFDDGDLVRVK
jgi:hypothetical protein